jgi:hypothetical protein
LLVVQKPSNPPLDVFKNRSDAGPTQPEYGEMRRLSGFAIDN